ncbi:MAG: transporter substrate-binding domain-containing protein [Rhodospirillales bacterium]|nr:transporter substrate-binding domain-containing protein [Rhodospirillales bacterium]
MIKLCLVAVRYLKLLSLLFLLLVTLPGTANTQEPGDLRVITAIFPPYSYEENGEVKGVAVDLIKKMFLELGLTPEIEIYPWARALYTARNTPNSLLFSVSRSAEREASFKWIGTIFDFDVNIFKKAERSDIVIKGIEDLNHYSFAGLIGDIKAEYLKNLGVAVQEVALEISTVKMLDAGRIDLIASDRHAMNFRLSNLGLRQDDFVSVFKLHDLSKPLYLVSSMDTDDQFVETLRQALERVRP